MRNTVDILGIPVDKVSMSKAVEIANEFLSASSVRTIYTPNAEIMMAAQRDPYVKTILKDADLLVADGAGVILASKILSKDLPERVAGFDLMLNIFERHSYDMLKCYFLGGKPGVAEEAAKNVMSRFHNVDILGCTDGYFSTEDTNNIIQTINSSGANILLVALGAPRQEKWIHENKNNLKVKICIGVGGTFDILAGKATRAPEFFQRNGLEWLYRLYKEPKRFIRMLDLPKFILLAILKKFGLRKS